MRKRANKEYKTDCFAYKPSNCVVLLKKNCGGCSFYKTVEEFATGQKNAMVRILSLDDETKERIKRAYYGGENDGCV